MSAQDLTAIRKRFDSNLTTLETKINSLTTKKLFGIWSDEFPNLLNQILEAFKIDLETNVFTSEEEDIVSILPTLNHRLDALASLIETVENTLCKNTAVHEFVSWILRELDVETKIPYLICNRQSLETIQIVGTCKLYFKGPLYSKVNEILDAYKDTYDDYSILFIPPGVLENKKYWSLIAHEIGHILNEISCLTENHNKRIERRSQFNQKFRNYYHSREFISDYIANLFFGPVYYESLNEYLNELDVQPGDGEFTHPFKDARLFFLQDVLDGKISNPIIVASEPARDSYKIVENLTAIICDTNDIVFESQITKYTEDPEEIANATEHLKSLIPYIGSPRILLNAYSKHYSEIITAIKEKTKQDDKEIQDNVATIIEDSIRLTNMKKTFDFTE